MDKRVTPSKRVTSPTWGPPPPCKQALNQHRSGRLHYLTSLRNFVSYVKYFCIMWLPSCSFCYEFLIIWRYCLYSLIRERLEDTNEAKFMDNRLWAVSYFFESYRNSTREPRETRKLTVIREKVDCKQFIEQEFFCFKVESASCFNGESQHAQSCESKRAFFRRVRRKEEKRRVGWCGGKGWQQTKKR